MNIGGTDLAGARSEEMPIKRAKDETWVSFASH
jgi:hypothetical protein